MRYASIRETDISDGPGVRVALYTQGCIHKCKGCFNEETWDPEGGKEFTEKEFDTVIALLQKNYIKGLSILGGDPFYQYDVGEVEKEDFLYRLIKQTHELGKDVWIWTGYTWETLIDKHSGELFNNVIRVLPYIDVIVDGPYIDSLRNLNLPYAGSENQRVIDVQKSLEKSEVVLYDKQEYNK